MEWYVYIHLQLSDQQYRQVIINLTAAQISLAVQNLLVVACSVSVGLTFYFRETLITEGTHSDYYSIVPQRSIE